MVKTVKITTDNRIAVVELPSWNLGEREKAIGADCTETVKTQTMYDLFRERIVMIVDESGHVKNRPINIAASYLYGYQKHKTPIAGDVIFGLMNGPDILPPDDAGNLLQTLKHNFSFLKEIKESEAKI